VSGVRRSTDDVAAAEFSYTTSETHFIITVTSNYARQSLTAAIIVDHCASSGSSFQNCFAHSLVQAVTFCAPPTDYCSFFILCTLLAPSRAYTTTISNNQSLKPTTNNCLSIKHSLQLKTFLYLFHRSFEYCTMNGRATNGISCLPHKYNGRAVCTQELHTTELM